MNFSEHYNLNLVQGTDIVNPLVQDVPNYETIDAEMYGNSITSVHTATELLSGTVHALTRDYPDAPMFRFVATANYTAGDTFTVDGIQVTALLPSGEALGSGAYVINSNVLCCLTGTLMTVFCTSGVVTTADNALKLGGELPSHYGTAADVQNAVTTAQSANAISLSNQQKVEAIESNLTANDGLVFNFLQSDGKYGYRSSEGEFIPFSSGAGVAGTFIPSTTASTKITLGFKPKKLLILFFSGSASGGNYYDEDVSSTNYTRYGGTVTTLPVGGGTVSSRILSIDDDGFTLSAGGSKTNTIYMAI